MSQVNNWNSLKGDGHTCDLMISYDGTILTTFLGQDLSLIHIWWSEEGWDRRRT